MGSASLLQLGYPLKNVLKFPAGKCPNCTMRLANGTIQKDNSAVTDKVLESKLAYRACLVFST